MTPSPLSAVKLQKWLRKCRPQSASRGPSPHNPNIQLPPGHQPRWNLNVPCDGSFRILTTWLPSKVLETSSCPSKCAED